MREQELYEALCGIPRTEITPRLTLTWHHRFRARGRVPEIVGRSEALMERWLTVFDLHDAAEIVLLITEYDLDAGKLSENYSSLEARESYQRLKANRSEARYMRALSALGMNDQCNSGLGREIKISI